MVDGVADGFTGAKFYLPPVEDFLYCTRGQTTIQIIKQEYPSLKEFLGELNENCLLLARHGETDWNAMNLIQGQQDRLLSPKGFVQRKNLFFLLQSIPLSRIFTSTLQRTIQTALPIGEARKIPLETLTELNEAKLGVFEGENKTDFADDYSKKMYQSFLEDEINVVLPGGGENLKMVDKRIRAPLSNILDAVKSSGHCLVVAHRNVNKMIVKNLLGLSIEEGYRVEHRHICLYIYSPGRGKIFLSKIKASGDTFKISEGYEKIGWEQGAWASTQPRH